MRLRTMLISPTRHLLSRVGLHRKAISSTRSSSSSMTPSSPQQSLQPEKLPRTIASLLHPTAQNCQPDADSTVSIHGWIKSIRKMGRVSFAHVTDGTTSLPLQAVLTKSQAIGLSTGSSVKVTGKWKPSVPGAAQQNELLAEEVCMIGEADPATYPLQKKYQTPEYLRTLPHLRPRVPFNIAVLQLRSFVSLNLTSFFAQNEFVQCYPPIITSSDCEGAGEVFTISSNEKSKEHFFRSPKYLTVSTQLHLEALAAALPRVWTLSPTFRAEKSDTHRHLSEFYMLEAELSFVESLDPLLHLIEDMIRQLVSSLAASRIGNDILFLSGDSRPQLEERWSGLIRADRWKRLTYSSAIEVLQAAVKEEGVEFQFPVEWGASLQSEHEKFLASLYNGPVFVTDYPREIKPFYMLPSSGGSRTVACFDLLFPAVGELIGGSLREHHYDELVRSMKSHGLIPVDGDPEQAGLKWYTDLRKWGSVPHGGFGMGLDRLLCYLTGVENIREVVAFPRWAGRCDA